MGGSTLRQKRKKKKSSAGAVLALVALLGCAAAVVVLDVGNVRERLADWLLTDKPQQSAPEPSDHGDSDNPQAAGTETPSADGNEAKATAEDAKGSGADGAQNRQGGGNDAAVDGWPRLATVRANADVSGLKEGAKLRIDLPAAGTFSYRQWRATPGVEGVQNDAVVASLIFEAALRAGLEVGERHIHPSLPTGTRAGFDVDVSEGKDLTLRNGYTFPVALTLASSGGTLIAEVKGDAPEDWKAPSVTVSEPQTFQPERMELVSADRSELGVTTGKPGLLVKVYVNGQLAHKDFYAPVPTRIVRAPSQDMQEAFRHDGSLSGS